MVRILYSVCGDGMGHAIRSDVILSKLKDNNNDILITAAGNAYDYLKKRYKNVLNIYGNRWVYKNNRISKIRTILKFVSEMIIKGIPEALRYYRMIKKFNPEIIVSDFESLSHYFGRLMNIPTISVDNIHAIYFYKRSPAYIKAIIRFLHTRSDYYIIPSFADDNIFRKDHNVYFASPIIRERILKIKPNDKGHVLVYQTSPTNVKMINVLKKSRRKFVIYGMKKRGEYGNITFKNFNENEFFSDLGNASYVIVNGGFNVITEALYLGKPIISIPIEVQYEQEFNAMMIEKKGYGKYMRKLTLKGLVDFENNLLEYKKNIKKGFDRRKVNHEFFGVLDNTIKKIIMKPK